ncbi:MAG: biotin--[acetyl-CoA-carboxylase] ligase [Coriobacteriales bacterium]|jgi:BirA family biotin operon repressor/biotin-[acetyl-CoA-carboxylase] ligase|nr:biotin--[acetyl-CoA-carboxylase] ligase [Coriobacteriales bacterium]
MDAVRLIPLIRSDCQLMVLRRVASTNDEARHRLKAGPPARTRPLVVISAEQTAGRGRQGHLWSSPVGGIYLSLLWQSSARSQQAVSIGLVAAQAVCAAVALFTDEPLRIKWPNDVLTPAGKLAGVLVENTDVQGTYIIGIGLNVTPPDDGGFEGAAYLANTQVEPLAAALIDALIERMRRWEQEGCPLIEYGDVQAGHEE